MPIYEYRCSSCSHELETLQKFSDPVLTACPACGADTLIKKISAAGFHLKGSGWYATDFKGSGSKPPAAKDKTDGASESKADKSEAKTGESKTTESKTTDSKTTESKTSQGKSDAAPAAPSAGASSTVS